MPSNGSRQDTHLDTATDLRPGSKENISRSGQTSNAPFHVDPTSAFYIFLVARAAAAFFSPIQDCDEVFNYWEPTHYLNHGYGMQTWEYSPQYAIRSWAYIALHALVILPVKLLPIGSKVAQFYFLRAVLAIVCAACETKLFSVISKTLNPRIAIIFMTIMISSTGMFHASTAYLPSSFAMYTTMLGMAAFMNWRGEIRTMEGIFWIGLGGVLGWPFAMAMVIPYMLEELFLAWALEDYKALLKRTGAGMLSVSVILGIQIFTDSFFYKKLVVVPFNIVWYNIFSSGKGPNIYGTESWDFYLRNLILNFNIWLLLALLAFPLALLQARNASQNALRQPLLRGVVFVTPLYLWLGVFSVPLHKEERFMYPAYPCIALNAAYSTHYLLSLLGSSNPRTFAGRIPAQLKLIIVSLSFLSAVSLGLWRAIGTTTAYSAPLHVYAPLRTPGMTRSGDAVCLGKEWYRFPSSYHLPTRTRAKFVKSEFRGLLPGAFSEAHEGFGVYPGTWLVPAGMNDENQEDPGKYTDVARCDFMVDSYFPGSISTKFEPHYVLDDNTWQRIFCEPFLDTSRTSVFGRLGLVPNWSFIPERFHRKWGTYCLLKRKN
ncbi:MAG: mannosyltransferase [Bogoriella megaspora]|nr:MAG: mannosyltransferase [Bogoriella megaspora]